MKKIVFVIAFLFLSQLLPAQTQFQFRYGSHYFDEARKVIKTTDGNFIVVGQTNGFGSSGNAFIMKVNSFGTLLWIKDYSGINTDILFDVIELSDNKLMMCGQTNSYGAGYYDGFVMKTDSIGDIIWAKAYGGISLDYFSKLVQFSSNEFYVAGYANDTTQTQKVSIMRIDSTGNILWNRWMNSLGAIGVDLVPIASGGVVVCGSYGLPGSGPGFDVLKFSSIGNLVWSYRYASAGGASGFSIIENNIGEIVVNCTMSNIYTVAHSNDNCIIKLDSNGTFIWSKCYGGTYNETVSTISNTIDGGMIMCGTTNSAGNGADDECLIKVQANGSVDWAKAYGTVWTEHPYNSIQTIDNGYLLAGFTYSIGNNGDSIKVYLVKTDSLGNSSCNDVSWTPIVTNQSITLGTPNTPTNFTFQVNPITWALNNRSFNTFDICNPTSVPSIADILSGCNIYPNPFSTTATIENAARIESATFELYNVFGQRVNQIQLINSKTEIKRDNLNAGVYIYQIISDDKTVDRGKLIIQ